MGTAQLRPQPGGARRDPRPHAGRPDGEQRVSFEVSFLRCPSGFSPGEAARWFADYVEPDADDELSEADAAMCVRIGRLAATSLGRCRHAVSAEHAELTWDSGLMLEFWPDEVTLTVPASFDDAARPVARIVGEETGLTGFDRRSGRPVPTAH